LRIFFVCKRRPQQRDLIEHPYGRFCHVPRALAMLGHDVRVALFSHSRLPAVETEQEGVYTTSLDLLTLGPTRVLDTIAAQVGNFRPDWIVGCSDAWVGVLAQRLATRVRCRLVLDAYDNFEAYMPWNLPLHWLWRRAIRAASAVTAAGPQLADHLQCFRGAGRAVDVLPMAADPQFRRRDRMECRAALGLPPSNLLIGYLGSWSVSRGSSLLAEAFARVRADHPQARLMLSGRSPASVLRIPGALSLGYLPDDQLPLLVSALDVACVVSAETAFGRFSYPAKLCEAMACAVPVVATATDALSWMLGGREAHLARPGDAGEFARKIQQQLEFPATDYGPQLQWREIGARFETILRTAR